MKKESTKDRFLNYYLKLLRLQAVYPLQQNARVLANKAFAKRADGYVFETDSEFRQAKSRFFKHYPDTKIYFYKAKWGEYMEAIIDVSKAMNPMYADKLRQQVNANSITVYEVIGKRTLDDDATIAYVAGKNKK